MSIPDRQRDSKGRFVDTDPTDRPTRPTAAQAQRLYAELDALNAKVAAQAGQLEDAANLAKSRLETLQGRNKTIQQLEESLIEAKRVAGARQLTIERLRTSEANLTTNLNFYTEQLTGIDGMIPLDLLPDTSTPNRLAQYLGELRNQATEALNERADMSRDKASLEALVADYRNAVLREERAGQSAALVGICIAVIVGLCAGWLARYVAEVKGWLHG